MEAPRGSSLLLLVMGFAPGCNQPGPVKAPPPELLPPEPAAELEARAEARSRELLARLPPAPQETPEEWQRGRDDECTRRAASFRFWTDARRGGVSDDLCEWQISLQNGVPEVSRATDIGSNEVPPFLDAALRARPFGGRQHWSRVPGGWLGAFDRGEWGASVWWFGPDGVSRERLGDLHVTAMLDVAGETWLTTGLDHMIYGRGSVLRAVQAGKHWSLVPLAELDQSAYAAVADDAEGGAAALVATRTELVRVTRGGDGGGEVAKLGDDLWGNMRPQNMARAADGTLWIGANHAVIRLVPRATRYESSWLASPDCAAAWPRTCGSRP